MSYGTNSTPMPYKNAILFSYPEHLCARVSCREDAHGASGSAKPPGFSRDHLSVFYAPSPGKLMKFLVDGFLRQGHEMRRSFERGKNRRGSLRNMCTILGRLEEAQSREIPGHPERDLIKGSYNGSAIGTLVDHSTRFVILTRGRRTSRQKRLESFARRSLMLSIALRKNLTNYITRARG